MLHMLSGLRGEIGALRHELVILQLGNASPRFTPKQVWHRFFVPFWGGRRHDSVGKKQVAMAWARIIENSRRSCDDYGFCFEGKWNGMVLMVVSCYWHFFFLQLPQCCSLPSHSSSSTSSNNSSSETNRQLRWALVALLGSSWNCRTIIQHVTVCHSRPTTGKQFVQTPLEKQKYFGQRTAERTWKDHVAQRHHTSSGQEDLTCPRSRLIGRSCTRYVSEIFRDV